ncbi:hypothetical protein BVG16_28840 [Paenibacillus selenitireducens]|uniref:Uncharacterized protein n=1 Tax=Paenibacillus selenitireducens TaxID=1324314 RepID=A0A1T2X0S1_9BACL|nr:hypothetical protein [Paenibacillus selenitireducens]OPA73470.1 hypothetical protein BVG16_28840 [Paenibacillus selenitireducens]
METIMSDLLSKVGIPSLVVSIFLFVIRIKPITLFTSSTIEQKILSKEKAFSIKVFKLLLEGLVTVILMFLITESLFKYKNLYYGWIALAITILLIVLLMFVMTLLELKEKTFIDLFGHLSNKSKIIIFIGCVITSLGYYLLPIYFIGTQIYSEVYRENISITELFGVLIAVLIMYGMITYTTLIPISRIIYRFLNFDKINSNLQNNKPVYFEDGGVKWYLFHPINESMFYLGNEPYLNSSNKFRFISKEDLMKQILQVD